MNEHGPIREVGHRQTASRVVLFDGQKVVRLNEWTFYDLNVAPGHHVVACRGPKLELDAKADEQYYVSVMQESGTWGQLTNHWLPRLIDPETGEDEMYPLLPAGKKDVYSGAR